MAETARKRVESSGRTRTLETGARAPQRTVIALDRPRMFELAADVTDAGGSMWTTGRGGSMSPLLRDGDRLLLAGNRRVLDRGDLVLVRVRGRLVVHRVVDLAPGRVRTRGDSCDVIDPWVSGDDVAARVIAAERDGRMQCVHFTLQFGWLALLRYAGARLKHAARGALRPWRRWVRGASPIRR